jgi:transposase InsO family protein
MPCAPGANFVLENVMLRHQINILRRKRPRPRLTTTHRFLIRDRDDNYGAPFNRAARGAGIRVIKTAVPAPNMNPIAERFVGSLRRELLDHVMVLDERHLDRVSHDLRSLLQLRAASPGPPPAGP